MSLAFRDATSGGSSAITATCVYNKPAVSVGDLMVAIISCNGSDTTMAGVPTNWTLLDVLASTTTEVLYTYIKNADANDGASFTWTFTAARHYAGGIVSYFDTLGSPSLDVHNIDNDAGASSATINCPSITTNFVDILLLAYGLNSVTTSAVFTPPAGFSDRINISNASSSKRPGGACDLLLGAAGASGVNTVNSSVFGVHVGSTIGIAPASSGQPVDPGVGAPQTHVVRTNMRHV